MKTLLTFLALTLAAGTFAQSNTEDVDLIQSLYGKEKKMIMSEFVTLDPATESVFWELYDAYEVERKALGKKRLANLDRYVKNYGKMDEATATSVIKEAMALGVATDKLVGKYHAKFVKSVGALPAAQFFQLEVLFLSETRVAILSNIPYIDDLRKD